MNVSYMRCIVLLIFAMVIVFGKGLCTASAVSSADSSNAFVALTPGKRYWISEQYYFTCAFDKKPQLGTAVIKIQIFTKDDDRDTSFLVQGEADMPGMRGAHSTGRQPFILNNKGDYLLPITVVMPGEWEVVVRFSKNNQVLFTGRLTFHV